MKPLPKISIVIPSYNKVKYIQETLESIVSQKYLNLEVIIQDGGSTDGTLEIVKKYAKKYSKIISWVSKKDKGQVDALNKGFKKAKGEILAFINADDVYEKNALLVVGEYFSTNPNTLWLVGKGGVIDENEKEIASQVTAYKNWLLKINDYKLLLMVNYLVQPSVFLSREAYIKYGPLTGTRKFVMEYELWLKLGRVSMPRVLDKSLSYFRLSGENISSTSFKNTLDKDYEIVRKFTNNLLILMIHKLHNIGRAITILFVNK
jgi:glycosyltransferase involved in cell wall biosynthesis